MFVVMPKRLTLLTSQRSSAAQSKKSHTRTHTHTQHLLSFHRLVAGMSFCRCLRCFHGLCVSLTPCFFSAHLLCKKFELSPGPTLYSKLKTLSQNAARRFCFFVLHRIIVVVTEKKSERKAIDKKECIAKIRALNYTLMAWHSDDPMMLKNKHGAHDTDVECLDELFCAAANNRDAIVGVMFTGLGHASSLFDFQGRDSYFNGDDTEQIYMSQGHIYFTRNALTPEIREMLTSWFVSSRT